MPKRPFPTLRQVLGAGLALTWLAGCDSAAPAPEHGVVHPEPRPGVSAARVFPAAELADHEHAIPTYAMAAEIPEILDGLYCYCGCHDYTDGPHYSLLTCFEDEHAATCPVCLAEAAMAYALVQEGRTLDEIRNEIDAAFASAAGSCGEGGTCGASHGSHEPLDSAAVARQQELLDAVLGR